MFHPKGPSMWELARQFFSSVEGGYRLLAPKFDYTPFRTPDELLERVTQIVAEAEPVDQALDVCCGTGAAMIHLRRVCRERIVGLDMTPAMMAVAKPLVEKAVGDAEIEFVRADALDMPFDSQFDLAVSFGAFGHIAAADEPRFVSEIHRSLKPGGRFIFVSGYRPSTWSLANLVTRLVNGVVRIRNLLIRPKFIMYYLTFCLPEVVHLLETSGFEVQTSEGVFEPPYQALVLVTARKRGDSALAVDRVGD